MLGLSMKLATDDAARRYALTALAITAMMVLASLVPGPQIPQFHEAATTTSLDTPLVQIHSSNSVVSWVNMTSKYTTAPSGRELGSMAYDSLDKYALLQGGYNGAYLGDSWEYNYSSGGWTPTTSVTAVTARWGSQMSYDSHDNEVLLYGGCSTPGCPRNCYWYYTLGGWDTLLCIGPPGGPPVPWPQALMLGGLADNPLSGNAVLFGGCTTYGTGGCTALSSNTWTFATGTWTQVTSPGPSARELFGMVWDPALSEIVLYGGYDGTKCLRDTWTFASGAWTNDTGSLSQSPGPLCNFAMTYDSLTRQVLLFGGYTTGGALVDNTWTFDSSGWTQVYPLNSPSARTSAMIAGPTGSDPVLFGGMGPGYHNDTWLYDGPLTSTLGASPASIDAGQNMTFTSSATGGLVPYTYAWSGLPTGCSGTTASITCTPTAAGTKNITVTITDAIGLAVSTSIMYTVHSDPKVGLSVSPSTIRLSQGTLFTASPTGGSGSVTYSWVDLPPACHPSLPSTSSFSCIPSKAGIYNVSVNVTDGNGFIGRSVVVPLTVKATIAPTIHAFLATPEAMTLGETTTLAATVSGGTGSLRFDYTGLPAGCATQNTTSLSCDPSVAGTFDIRFYANDTFNDSATATTPLTVNPAPAISGFFASPSPVSVGNTSYLNVTASGGTGWLAYAFAGLPQGCLSGNTSSLACVPTVTGNFTIRVYVNDSTGASTNGTVGLMVFTPLAISGFAASPNPIKVDQQTFINVTAAGGIGTLTYTYAGLPGGCSSSSVASLACTPTASGTFEVRVFVNDTAGHSEAATTSLAVEVVSLPVISHFIAAPDPVHVGRQAYLNVTASGGSAPLKYAYTGLPAGCLTANTASLSCTSTATGTFNIRVFVNDSASHSTSATTNLTVSSVTSLPSISSFTATPDPITLGQTTHFDVTASGGTGTLRYAYTGLPPGCTTLNTTSLACVPTAAGSFAVRVFVNDSESHSTNGMTTLTVNTNIPPLQVAVNASVSHVYVGGVVTLTATASGGQPAYTYRWSLNGTNISMTLGVWNVTLGHVGNYTYRAWVVDGRGIAAVSTPVTLRVTVSQTGPGNTTGSSGLGTTFGLLLLLVAALIVAAVIIAVVWRRRARRNASIVAPPAAAEAAVVETKADMPSKEGAGERPELPPKPSGSPEWDESGED